MFNAMTANLPESIAQIVLARCDTPYVIADEDLDTLRRAASEWGEYQLPYYPADGLDFDEEGEVEVSVHAPAGNARLFVLDDESQDPTLHHVVLDTAWDGFAAGTVFQRIGDQARAVSALDDPQGGYLDTVFFALQMLAMALPASET